MLEFVTDWEGYIGVLRRNSVDSIYQTEVVAYRSLPLSVEFKSGAQTQSHVEAVVAIFAEHIFAINCAKQANAEIY